MHLCIFFLNLLLMKKRVSGAFVCFAYSLWLLLLKKEVVDGQRLFVDGRGIEVNVNVWTHFFFAKGATRTRNLSILVDDVSRSAFPSKL